MASLKNFLLSEETDRNFSLEEIFKQISEEVANLAIKEGIIVCPYLDSNLKYFSELSYPAKKAVVEKLRNYLKACIKTLHSGAQLYDTKQLTWNAIKEFKLLPATDLLFKINYGDVIEIYDPEFKPLFRSLQFFESSSYSLEDLYCREITDIYQKEDNVLRQLSEHSARLFRGEKERSYSPRIAEYIAKEKDSRLKHDVKVNIHYISPLFTAAGNVGGIVLVEDCEIT